MTPKVQRWGNSLAVRIPAPLARKLELIDGSEVEIAVERGRLVIEPVRRAPTLAELLAGVTPENRHHDLDWRPLESADDES